MPPDENDAWFRPPTYREHRIAAGLFLGFGLFFAALFVLAHGWWFRWVLAGLGAYSLLVGLRHVRQSVRRLG